MVGQSEAALLAAAQAAARTGKFSLHDCSDGRTHEAVWSLQSFDADEVRPVLYVQLYTSSDQNHDGRMLFA